MEIFTVWTVSIYTVEGIHLKNMKAYNDHDYCHVEMPNEYNKALEYNHGKK